MKFVTHLVNTKFREIESTALKPNIVQIILSVFVDKTTQNIFQVNESIPKVTSFDQPPFEYDLFPIGVSLYIVRNEVFDES